MANCSWSPGATERALADRSLDRLRPLLRLLAVREGLGLRWAPFYSHLRTVGNRVGQRTDDALNR